MKSSPTFPVYVFKRRHEIETPDRILAGTLRLNTLGRRTPTSRQRHELTEIIAGLTADARAGRLPDIVVGWPDIRLPLNAADVTNEAVMAHWNARAFTVFVRVDPSGDQTITRARGSDSDRLTRAVDRRSISAGKDAIYGE